MSGRSVRHDQVWRFDETPAEGAEDEAIFEPDVIALMRRALEASWSALAFAHFDDELEMRATREALAKRILEGAAGGERRIPVLSGDALGAIEPRRARNAPRESAGETTWRVSRYAS